MWLWILVFILLFILFYNFVYKYLISLIKVGNLHQTAIVITGCDSGFGRELTIKCLRSGFTVFAGCFSSDSQEGLKTEAGEDAKLYTFVLDVGNDESVEEARKYVEDHLGNLKLHALVNNAGIPGVFAPDTWCPIKAYEMTMNVNFYGTIRMCHAFSPLLKRDLGRIVNMASVNGKIALPYTAPYCVSKCALNAYSDIIRREMAAFGVKVVILEPSFYKTPLMKIEPLFDIDENFCSKNTHEVVNAYFDAITNAYPELRYHPGLHAKFLFIPAQFLSTAAQDLLYSLLQKLSPQPSATKVKSN